MKRRIAHKVEYKTPEDLKRAINSYFDHSDETQAPYTISGLCLAIGYSRDMFLRHTHDSELGNILMQARLLLEQQHEVRLLTSGKPTGTIFALKNLGWSDRSSVDVGITSGSADNPEALKWTVEVIAPGQARNLNGKTSKIKTALGQEPYYPPALTTDAVRPLELAPATRPHKVGSCDAHKVGSCDAHKVGSSPNAKPLSLEEMLA